MKNIENLRSRHLIANRNFLQFRFFLQIFKFLEKYHKNCHILYKEVINVEEVDILFLPKIKNNFLTRSRKY